MLGLFIDAYMIFFLTFFIYKSILLEAIKMSTNNISFYKEADKNTRL